MAQDNVKNESQNDSGTVNKVARKPAAKAKAAVKTVAKPKATPRKTGALKQGEKTAQESTKESAKNKTVVKSATGVSANRSKAVASKVNTAKPVSSEESIVKKVTPEKEPINIFTEKSEKDVSSADNNSKESDVDSLGDKIKSATKNLEDNIKYFGDTGFEKLYDYTEQLSDKTRANLKHWNSLLNDTNEMLMDKFFEKSKELREYATKKPVSALLISTGIGVALYKAFKRR